MEPFEALIIIIRQMISVVSHIFGQMNESDLETSLIALRTYGRMDGWSGKGLNSESNIFKHSGCIESKLELFSDN